MFFFKLNNSWIDKLMQWKCDLKTCVPSWSVIFSNIGCHAVTHISIRWTEFTDLCSNAFYIFLRRMHRLFSTSGDLDIRRWIKNNLLNVQCLETALTQKSLRIQYIQYLGNTGHFSFMSVFELRSSQWYILNIFFVASVLAMNFYLSYIVLIYIVI